MIQKKTRLAFVRHGETHANVQQLWHGQTDTELTDKGRYQAKQLGKYFQHYMVPDTIYASPLQRAHITAQEIAEPFKLPVNLDPRLMEFHLGDWEGLTFEEMRAYPQIKRLLSKEPTLAAPNGESQQLVKNRVVEAIEEIIGKHPQQNIVLVAHGVAIAIALAHYLEGDTTTWIKYNKSNTAFSELCFDSNQLISFNKTDHLKSQDNQDK